MKIKTQKCKVCRKEIKTTKQRFGRGTLNYKITEFTSSDEGVYFSDSKAWFCNDCWEQIIGKQDNSIMLKVVSRK